MMVITQILLLNLLWFASVIGAANGNLLPAFCCAMLLLSVVYIYQGLTRADLKIIAISLISGLLIDGFLNNTGWLIYASQYHQVRFLPPGWIMLLWLGFGATLRTGMSWMFKSPLAGAGFILVGAPLSYFSAERLGAVQLIEFWPVMFTIAGTWLIYFLIILLVTGLQEQRDDLLA